MSASLLVDRVKILILSAGTGPFALGPAVPKFRGIEALVDGAVYSYGVEGPDGSSLFEAGTGTYVASLGQFIRAPQISSNGGATVNFPVNCQLVFTALAADLVATGGTFPIVNSLGNSPSVAIAQQAATVAIGAASDAAAAAVAIAQGRATYATSRTALKALPVTQMQACYLQEGGRSGWFILKTGTPPSDPNEGIYLVSAIGGYFWQRDWDGDNGRPEWFGAITGSQSGTIPADNITAIKACFALCPVTQFTTGNYFINGTLQFNVSFRSAIGPTGAWDDTGKGARILSSNLTADAVLVGDASAPATDMYFENLCAMHTSTPPNPGPGNEASAKVSWQFLKTTSTVVRRLSAFNALVGFRWNGNVAFYANDCRSFNPAIYGFWAYDTGSHPGLAGGNGSLYIERCNVTGGVSSATVGLYANGDFADLFLEKFETSGTPRGILLDGTGSTYSGGHGDVRIVEPTIDTATICALEIRNTNPLAKIQLNGGYYQLNDNGGTNKCVWFHDGGGYITVTGVQLTGSASSTTSIGMRIDAQPNVVVDASTIIENFPFPMDCINGCARPTILCQIQAGQLTAGHAALTVDNAGEGWIAPNIAGSAGSFITGINLNGSGNTRLTVDLTRVDIGALGAGGKCTINGAAAAAPGFYKPNGTSGTYADNGVEIRGFPG